MDILVNDNVVNTLLNDAQFRGDFKAMLQTMIDEELAKEIDDMDCDLIDECTNMLIELEQEEDNGFPVIIPPVTAKQIMKACSKRDHRALSWGMRASIVACVLLFSTITCNAAVTKITGRNIAQEVATSIEEKLTEWGLVSFADDKTNETPVKVIPLGNENIDGGFEDDEQKGNENIDGGFEDDEPKGNENIDGGFEDDEPKGNENIDAGFEDDEPKGNENIDAGFEDDTQKPAAQYTITFDSAGGSMVPSKLVSYGKPMGVLPIPIREGYIFKGWYNIDVSYQWKTVSGILTYQVATPITPNTIYKLKRNATLTAEWEKAYTIKFDAMGGTCDVNSMYVDNSAKLPKLPVPKAPKEGYVFDYWYYEVNFRKIRADENTVYTKDTTLYASYVIDEKEFVMQFFSENYAIDEIEPIPIFYGKPYGELPTPQPPEEGMIFIGWFDGDKITDPQITAETIHNKRENIYANALWTERIYDMYLDVNGGNETYEPMKAYEGHKIGNLPTPTREGYTFKYWDFYGVSAEKQTVPDITEFGMEDITLVAMWTAVKPEIVFDGNGGDVRKNNYTYTYDQPYKNLPEATRPDYDFAGWYTEPEGGELITEESLVKIAESGMLYAHWTEATDGMVYVTVHNNRSVDDTYTIEYEPGTPLGKLETPKATTDTEKYGATFLGWFDDKYYGNEVTADTIINENIDVYAHWGLSSIARQFVKIYITGVKETYNIDEPIDFDSINVTLHSVVSGVEDADFREIFDGVGETMEEHFINADTSTPGEHTMTFRFAREEFVILSLGTLYIDQDVSYTVVGCNHKTTQLQNFVQADCRQKGYTGDVVCVDCGKVIEEGYEVDKLPHGELRYVERQEPTCTSVGYEAHYRCTVCGEAVNEITLLNPLNHPASHLENYKEPTCGEYGYTGDMICDLCGAVAQHGSQIDKLPHGAVVLKNATEGDCGSPGYTGDKVCSTCGEIVEKGKYITIAHGETELLDAKEPTCGERGYTGDEYCTVCGTMVKKGKYIASLDHQNTTIVDAAEATCTGDGYTGDEVCTDCGTIIKTGKVIAATGHPKNSVIRYYQKGGVGKEGYYNDVCTECGNSDYVVVEALAVPELSEYSHTYDGNKFVPDVIVKDVKGNIVTSYKTTVPSSPVDAGTYTIKITFNGDYEGTYELTYTIATANQDVMFTGFEDGRALTLYWNEVDNIDGYEFQLWSVYDKLQFDFMLDKSQTSITLSSTYCSGFYYALIRTYKIEVVDGVETYVYSDWSPKYFYYK